MTGQKKGPTTAPTVSGHVLKRLSKNRTDLPMIDSTKQAPHAARVDYAHFGA